MIKINHNKNYAENITSTATIPNDCVARLMYYLECIETVTNFGIPYSLRNYSNYRSLDSEDKRNLLRYCQALTIRVLQAAKLFILVDDRDMKNTSNEFYKITQETQSFGMTRDIVIAGKRVRAVKIMFFSMEWANRNYINPLRELENQFTTRVRIVYMR